MLSPKKKIEIISAREWKDHYSLQVVYEWEDILKSELGIPLNTRDLFIIDDIYTNKLNAFLQKFIRHSFLKRYIDSSFNFLLRKRKSTYFICYQLYVNDLANHYIYQPNCIPIFIDCFRDMVDKIPVLCKKNPLIFVTDYEIFQLLQKTTVAYRGSHIYRGVVLPCHAETFQPDNIQQQVLFV